MAFPIVFLAISDDRRLITKVCVQRNLRGLRLELGWNSAPLEQQASAFPIEIQGLPMFNQYALFSADTKRTF